MCIRDRIKILAAELEMDSVEIEQPEELNISNMQEYLAQLQDDIIDSVDELNEDEVEGETEIQDNNSLLNEKIIKVVGTTSFDNSAIGAFAALKEDGSVVTWGSRKVGGHQEIVNNNGVITDLKNKLNSNVKDIIGIKGGFIAHKTDNTVISWGWHESTGNIDTPSNRGSSSPEDITSYSYLKYIGRE